MAFKRLSPEALYVTYGFGQVEPNHLSAQRTGEIYAQLPAAKEIKILENGQFAKYNYVNNTVDFAGVGEWMLVFNEVKVYAKGETDQDFAMIRRDYTGSVYSPVGVTGANGKDLDPLMKTIGAASEIYPDGHTETYPGEDFGRNHFAIGNKYEIEVLNQPQLFTDAQGIMVPRLFKTHEGDIFTTNTIAEAAGSLKRGDLLAPNAHGYLAKVAAPSGENAPALPAGMVWQVVKVYNLGDMQPAVKVMRVQ